MMKGSFVLSVALLAFAAMAATAAADAPTNSLCNAAYPGAYHLSCYTANETVAAVLPAKTQCFNSFVATNSSCGISFVSNGTAKYGCGTYVTYEANTQACLDAYQAQEKTNPACALYKSAGLGAAYNKLTANVSSAFNCSSSGPCYPGKAGTYHFSCYTKDLAPNMTTGAGGANGDLALTVAAAKNQCITAFLATANATKAGCGKKDAAIVYGKARYNCDVYTSYTLGSKPCLDAYQAQEKTNPACTYYNNAKLADAKSRGTPTPFLNTAYTCPASN